MMGRFLLVMGGAGLGALLRYLLLAIFPLKKSYFTGVFWINVLGSLVMGFLFTVHLDQKLVILLETGLLGGFTTFSTMMTESAQQQNGQRQMVYLLVQLLAGLVAFTIGLVAGQLLEIRL
ncbi:fluoride efflux transporter FluC [Fructobacillus fructosus]|uniref:fluoride efflux transporter FluC n=1 Tax=Fructobacillus fructosus TaxID=1631 RepID=UPI00200AFF4E|nr:CrcB family protein [Fructobacillus fructosus]MCK8637873.1 CrcB family protein [Fructobacillus fructosus]